MRLTEAEARKLGIEIPPKTMAKRKPKHKWSGDSEPINGDGLTGSDPIFDQLCLKHGLPLPDTEVQFCPGRKFKADYIFEGWLIVEIDGGIFGRGKKCPTCGRRRVGAHSSIGQQLKDREKDIEAICLGYTVIRITPNQVKDGSGFAIVKRVLGSKEEQS